MCHFGCASINVSLFCLLIAVLSPIFPTPDSIFWLLNRSSVELNLSRNAFNYDSIFTAARSVILKNKQL